MLDEPTLEKLLGMGLVGWILTLREVGMNGRVKSNGIRLNEKNVVNSRRLCDGLGK